MYRRTGSGRGAIGAAWVALALALVGAAAACNDPLPPQEDATIPIDVTIDDARTCALPGDCPCFSNHDCPATHACVSQDPGGETVSCIEGPRGSGVPGVPCGGEQDCASGLCVDDAGGGRRCSDLCTLPSMCPPELPRCIFLDDEGICARPR